MPSVKRLVATSRPVRRLEASEPRRSIELYRDLLARQPGFAESHYRLARLLEVPCRDEAYQHYVAARDLDGMPIRCLTVFQQAYRDVAASHDFALVDGQALFHAIGVHGLLDDFLFNDVMHPALRGHIALARGILEARYMRDGHLAGRTASPRRSSTRLMYRPLRNVPKRLGVGVQLGGHVVCRGRPASSRPEAVLRQATDL